MGNYLTNLKESLEKREMGQLAEIRVIYTYTHTQSECQKRNRQSNPNIPKPSQTDVKKTLRISLDGEKHIKLILSEVWQNSPLRIKL